MTYDGVVKTLLHDNIEVYSVAVASAFLERKFSRLVDYAHDSGGEVYFAASARRWKNFTRGSARKRATNTLSRTCREHGPVGGLPQGGSAGEARRAHHQDPRPLLQWRDTGRHHSIAPLFPPTREYFLTAAKRARISA